MVQHVARTTADQPPHRVIVGTMPRVGGCLERYHPYSIDTDLTVHKSPSLEMPVVLIVGATRGLGYQLAKQYASRGDTVYGTARSEPAKDADSDTNWISNIDIAEESAGKNLAKSLHGRTVDILILTAGYFGKESFDKPDFEKEVLMYKTSAIGPVFVVHNLFKSGALSKESKVIIVSSESGSIALRHESEGGGNFGHHGSKAASNMVGKLLSLDLKEHGVAVGIVHPGFM